MQDRLKKCLVSLANASEEPEFSKTSSAENYIQNLNQKHFMDITYFLIKVIDKNAWKKLPWPVMTKNEKALFMKEFFNAVEEMKKQYPSMHIIPVQRSQFSNPCAENKKVIEFLLNLSTLAIFVFTGCRPFPTDVESANSEAQMLESEYEETMNRITKLKENIEMAEKCNKQCPELLERLKADFVTAGIVKSEQDVNVPNLMRLKKKMEDTLASSMIQVEQELRKFMLESKQ